MAPAASPDEPRREAPPSDAPFRGVPPDDRLRRRSESDVRPGTVLQRGRAKAYRPLPLGRRLEILEAGLAAYAAREYFEAHEVLEPAWMGTPDEAERDLLQGLIKLAAAYVHRDRGNPLGMRKNLAGARDRLAGGLGAGPVYGIDAASLLAAVDALLDELDRTPTALPDGVVAIPRAERG